MRLAFALLSIWQSKVYPGCEIVIPDFDEQQCGREYVLVRNPRTKRVVKRLVGHLPYIPNGKREAVPGIDRSDLVCAEIEKI